MSREHNREPIKHTCPDIDKYIKWIKMEIVKDRDLVIIDFEKAIQLGYVKLCNEIRTQYLTEYGE